MSKASITSLLAGVFLFACAGLAHARPTIVFLSFGGEGSEALRAKLVRALEQRYDVLPGKVLLDALDALGVPMSRGPNLARAAAEVGAVAVVGGAVQDGSATFAVYSGRTGQPLITGTAPASDLRQALAVILGGLKKAPKQLKRRRAARRESVGERGGGAGAGEATTEDGSGDALVFEPVAVDAGGGGQRDDSEENPLAHRHPEAAGGAGESLPPDPALRKAKQREEDGAWPRLAATVGLGTWTRSFRLHDPYPEGSGPEYTSGTTFALKLAAEARPAAFFTEGFASRLYARLRYQQTLGLESRSREHDPVTGAGEDRARATTLRELLLDFGVDWPIKAGPLTPHLKGGLGFGLMDFVIDWTGAPERPLPDASYRFFLLSAGCWTAFHRFFGAHFGFDYRAVGPAGEVEDGDLWYGAASVGGISLNLGLDGNWKGIIASLDYTYTRYFYSFRDGDERAQAYDQDKTTRAAGGALDIQHALMINAGYSY